MPYATNPKPTQGQGPTTARPVDWFRMAVVAALVVALMAGAVLSPAGAGTSRGFVKKLVTKRIDALRQELGDSIRATRMNASSVQLLGPLAVAGTGDDVAITTLSIPDAGNYIVSGKLWWTVVDATSTGSGGEIDCDLLAGGDFDTSRESGVTEFDYGALSLQLTHVFTGPGTVVLRCRDEFQGGNPVEVHNVVVTAFEVFALSSTRVDRTAGPEPPVQGTRP